MRVGSLFAGIGGFDLAAKWMGWTTVWYSEIDPYACRVMERWFPNARNVGDVGGRVTDPNKVSDTGKDERGKKRQITLADMVRRRMWPTPQAHDAAKGEAKRVGRYGTKHGARNLNDEVALDAQTPLTSSSADSLASPCLLQGKVWPNPMTAGSGQSLPESFAYYDRDTCVSRTYQGSLFEAEPTLLTTLPRQGMMLSGRLYQQQPLVRLTDVTESGSWPTPNAAEAHAEKYTLETSFRHFQEGRQVHLSQVVRDDRMWPTPTGNDANQRQSKGTPSFHRQLAKGQLAAAAQMWPTPTALDGKERTYYSKGDLALGGAVRLRTPNATDWKNRGTKEYRDEQKRQIQLQTQVGGQLNPTFVEWLMGFPKNWTEV
jgi:DNA (cytosine-5)-methyltransferase 1